MATILKIKYQSDTHRVPLQDVTFHAVQRIVEDLYPEKLVMKYVDEEKDLCTLCPATFADFVSLGTPAGEKTMLRLELSARQPAAPPAADELPGWSELRDLQGGLGALFEVLQGIKGKGTCKGKGKCFGKGARHWEHPWDASEPGGGPPLFGMFPLGGCGRFRCVMKIATALRQLHASGSLSAKAAAGVVVASLGELASVVADHATIIDATAAAHPEVVKKMVEELIPHVVAAEVLDQCAVKMEALLSGDGKVSETLLHLFTSLDGLPFGLRVSFLEGLCNSQQSRIDDLLSKAGPFLAMLPPVETEHSNVVCDGCQMAPLRGPRFKCKNLDDYDLCATCYASKDTVNGGECDGHEFKMITRTDHMAGKGWWCQKGKGKCKGKGEDAATEHGEEQGQRCFGALFEVLRGIKGKCKGKGKGKGKWKGKDAEAAQPEGEATEAKHGGRCASEGCDFVATWHPTHCCNACMRHGPSNHGPACKGVSCSAAEEEAPDAPAKTADVADEAADVPEPSAPPPESVAREPAVAETVEPPASKRQFDLSIPVALEDGRHLAIEWNVGDDIEQVAQKFAAEHSILPEELPTIKVFLESVMSAVGQNAR